MRCKGSIQLLCEVYRWYRDAFYPHATAQVLVHENMWCRRTVNPVGFSLLLGWREFQRKTVDEFDICLALLRREKTLAQAQLEVHESV